MSEATVYALLSTAAATALFHTLIPDHWLPFVLIGRARGWSSGMVASVAGASAMLHVLLSIGMGFAALALGIKAMEALGETLHRVGAILLIVFGVGYALWAVRKGGHFHPGGALLHDSDLQACAGEEGPGHPEHLHYHADHALIRGASPWGAIGLAVIVGLNPCVLILPILLASAPLGASTVLMVTLAYAIPTAMLMVGLSVLGVRAGRQVRLPVAAQYMEAISGLLVAALGVAFWVVDV